MYEDESEGPKGTFEIYKAEADTLYKQGEYRKAIEGYTTVRTLKLWSQFCGHWHSWIYTECSNLAYVLYKLTFDSYINGMLLCH